MNIPRIVAVLLILCSFIPMVSFATYPVFSQDLSSTAITQGPSVTTGYNRTVTLVHTYQTTGFTTSSSVFTQIMVAFVTSTTFFTYVQITFTSSTSTAAYPAPPVRPSPNSMPLQLKSIPGSILSLFAILLVAIFGFAKRRKSPSY